MACEAPDQSGHIWMEALPTILLVERESERGREGGRERERGREGERERGREREREREGGREGGGGGGRERGRERCETKFVLKYERCGIIIKVIFKVRKVQSGPL